MVPITTTSRSTASTSTSTATPMSSCEKRLVRGASCILRVLKWVEKREGSWRVRPSKWQPQVVGQVAAGHRLVAGAVGHLLLVVVVVVFMVAVVVAVRTVHGEVAGATHKEGMDYKEGMEEVGGGWRRYYKEGVSRVMPQPTALGGAGRWVRGLGAIMCWRRSLSWRRGGRSASRTRAWTRHGLRGPGLPGPGS